MKKQVLIIVSAIVMGSMVMFFEILSLTYWLKDTIIKEPVNICGQTMAEANEAISWHNGVYSPEGCELIKK